MSEGLRTVHLRIEGRVQGVYFRVWTAEQAEELGIAGWVRNRRDRTVEALFHGPAEAVALMLERCRTGPRGARVEKIEVTEESGAVAVVGFEILADGR